MVTGASSTELTGKFCSRYASQWLEDSYTLAAAVIKASNREKGKKWFFITLDNAFGLAVLKDGERMVKETGGTIRIGSASAWHMSLFLLQAQGSGADYIALANVGLDTTNAVKQAREFNIIARGKKLLVFSAFVTDIDAMGLNEGQGLVLPSGFYWDDNHQTQAFASRFFKLIKRCRPTRMRSPMRRRRIISRRFRLQALTIPRKSTRRCEACRSTSSVVQDRFVRMDS